MKIRVLFCMIALLAFQTGCNSGLVNLSGLTNATTPAATNSLGGLPDPIVLPPSGFYDNFINPIFISTRIFTKGRFTTNNWVTWTEFEVGYIPLTNKWTVSNDFRLIVQFYEDGGILSAPVTNDYQINPYVYFLRDDNNWYWDDSKGTNSHLVEYRGDETKVSIPETMGGAPLRSIRDYVFANTNLNVRDITVPASIRELVSFCFNNYKITNIVLSEGLRAIRSYCFVYSSVSTLDLPQSLETVDYAAFSSAYQLRELKFPTNITVIPYALFWRCTNLTNVVLSSNVTWISNYSFGECSNIASIYVPAAQPPKVEKDFLSNANTNVKIYVPMGSVTDYKTNFYWKFISNRIYGY